MRMGSQRESHTSLSLVLIAKAKPMVTELRLPVTHSKAKKGVFPTRVEPQAAGLPERKGGDCDGPPQSDEHKAQPSCYGQDCLQSVVSEESCADERVVHSTSLLAD